MHQHWAAAWLPAVGQGWLHLLQANSTATISRTLIFLSPRPGRRNRTRSAWQGVRHCHSNLASEVRSDHPEIRGGEGSRALWHPCCCPLARSKHFGKLSHHPSISCLPSRCFQHPGHHFAVAMPLLPGTGVLSESNGKQQKQLSSIPPLWFCSAAAMSPPHGGSCSPGDGSVSPSSLSWGAAPPRPARGSQLEVLERLLCPKNAFCYAPSLAGQTPLSPWAAAP